MNLYQCRKCGWEIPINKMIKNPTVICRCGHKMVKVSTGEEKGKEYMQLRLFG